MLTQTSSSMKTLLSARQMSNNSPHPGNDSIDVMLNGCFDDYNTIICVRSGVMSMLVLVTGALCIGKACRLHLNHHSTLNHFLIFYCATVECTIQAIHWLVWKYEQLHFVTQYLKIVQFLIVLHLYWSLASRSLRKEEVVIRIIRILLLAAFVYFTAMVTLACVNIQSSWTECLQNYWLALSATEFMLVQLFLLAGLFISSRLNEISTLESARNAQKRDLWILIVVFEISAVVVLSYDIVLRVLGDEIDGCSGVFLHHQEIYSAVFAVFMIFKFLLPIWAMLLVFIPLEMAEDQTDELLPAINDDGAYTSLFSAQRPSRGRFKPFYHQPTGAFNSPGSLPGFSSVRRNTASLQSISEEEEEEGG